MRKLNPQIQKIKYKYRQDINFINRSTQQTQKYNNLLKQSQQIDLQEINQDLLICYHQRSYPIYFYFSTLQNTNKAHIYKTTLYFIKNFNRLPNQDYIFVFFNTNANYHAFTIFKNIFLQLSVQHFLHLKQFVVVRPNLYQRAQNYISTKIFNIQSCYYSQNIFSNHLNSVITYISNPQQLCNHLSITLQDLIHIIPKQISKFEFPNIKQKQFNLFQQRINFSGQLLSEKQKQLKKKFQLQIKSFLTATIGNHRLSDYERNQIGIPIILSMLVYYFKIHPQKLKQQGIFRKSVSIQQQRQILQKLQKSTNYDFLLTLQNGHLIANLIKRFFSNLSVPLFPYQSFQSLMHDQGVSNKKQLIKNIVNQLPQINYLCLVFLIQFLILQVISNVMFNKMNALNLSIIFGPCLLRAEKQTVADLIFANKCSIVIKIILQNFQQIFGQKNAIINKFHSNNQNSIELFQSEINSNIQIQKKIKNNYVTFGKQDNKQSQKNENLNQKKFDKHSDLLQTSLENSNMSINCQQHEKQHHQTQKQQYKQNHSRKQQISTQQNKSNHSVNHQTQIQQNEKQSHTQKHQMYKQKQNKQNHTGKHQTKKYQNKQNHIVKHQTQNHQNEKQNHTSKHPTQNHQNEKQNHTVTHQTQKQNKKMEQKFFSNSEKEEDNHKATINNDDNTHNVKTLIALYQKKAIFYGQKKPL